MTTPEAAPTGTPVGPATHGSDAAEPGRPAWAVVGALLFLVLGLAMLVPAVHVATEPLLLPTSSGPMFDCGTALQPPTKPFPVRVCGSAPRRAQQQAGAWAAGAVIVGVGGALAFLVPTRSRSPRRGRRRVGVPVTELTPHDPDAG